MILLSFVQSASLGAVYWFITNNKHALSIVDFVMIAGAASIALLIGSMMLFKQMIIKLQEREKTLLFQSRHDPITLLPNRKYFFEYFNQMLQNQNPEKPLAIMTIGIERFPQINQALGYQIGDRLISHVSKRLQNSLKDAVLIGRFANNIFIALLPDITHKNYLMVADKVKTIFESPFSVYTVQIDLDVLIGFSFLPHDGIDAAPLIQKADLALYGARDSVDKCEIYRQEKDPHHKNKISLMSELREGLSQNEFVVFYQPKVNLSRGHITQVEALIRWLHPIRGSLAPTEFIPLAEETGHIKHLTLWLLEHGIWQCSEWHKQNKALGISINLSVTDLFNKKLPIIVASLIKEHGISPSWLTLEITESAFMRDPEHAIDAAYKLIQLGVHLSIDDFGTGYSSLSYLKKLPVNELKIDKSFTQDIIHSERVAQIVQSTIRLGHGINVSVVAEGINDENTLKMLKHFGCDLGQGYYFSQPLPLNELTTWLNSSSWGITFID